MADQTKTNSQTKASDHLRNYEFPYEVGLNSMDASNPYFDEAMTNNIQIEMPEIQPVGFKDKVKKLIPFID